MTLAPQDKISRIREAQKKLDTKIWQLEHRYKKLEAEVHYLEDLLEISESDAVVLDRPDKLRSNRPAPAGSVPDLPEPPARPAPKPPRDTPPCSSCGDLKTFRGSRTLQNGKTVPLLICEECSNEQLA